MAAIKLYTTGVHQQLAGQSALGSPENEAFHFFQPSNNIQKKNTVNLSPPKHIKQYHTNLLFVLYMLFSM